MVSPWGLEVKCIDSGHVNIFIRSSLSRQRWEKHDLNLHNQNTIHISIQPNSDQYTTSHADNPASKGHFPCQSMKIYMNMK